jgi:hypothetical protein
MIDLIMDWVKSAGMAAISLCACASGANIVMNGNFSSGVTHNQVLGSVTNVLPDQWDNAPASISKLNVIAAGSNGYPVDPLGSAFYMAFQSPSQDNTQDCFYQIFNTTAGQSYTLSFWLAIVGSSPYLQLTPDWDVTSPTGNRQLISIPGYNSSANPDNPITTGVGPAAFKQYSFTLTASTNSTFTFFHGLDSGGGAVLLADVSLTADQPIPEPLTPWLIGFGLATLGLLGRTRKALPAD